LSIYSNFAFICCKRVDCSNTCCLVDFCSCYCCASKILGFCFKLRSPSCLNMGLFLVASLPSQGYQMLHSQWASYLLVLKVLSYLKTKEQNCNEYAKSLTETLSMQHTFFNIENHTFEWFNLQSKLVGLIQALFYCFLLYVYKFIPTKTVILPSKEMMLLLLFQVSCIMNYKDPLQWRPT
jgi:hypothetical protein